MSRSQQLREAIQSSHADLESLPFAAAMARGKITRSEYRYALGQLYYVHQGAELEWKRFPELNVIYSEKMDRTEDILNDLSALGAKKLESPLPQVRDLVRFYQELSKRDPWTLLGVLYVLEGSRMGSIVLALPLSKALQVSKTPGNGLDYHLTGLEVRPHVWKNFREKFDNLPLTDSQSQEVIRTAEEMMKHLYKIYAQFPASKANAMTTMVPVKQTNINNAVASST